MLIAAPVRAGATAMFIGTFTVPYRSVMPAAKTTCVPVAVIVGPIPNSTPFGCRSPRSHDALGSGTFCSKPPTSSTSSVTTSTGTSGPMSNGCSNCQPKSEVIGEKDLCC